MGDSKVHIFGIRHHGPGSARSLLQALEGLQPDCVLIEGPPDAEDILSLAAHEEMKPPVALLIYDPEKPARSAFYPFAVFSPEWQAIRYSLANSVPVRFMDLPQSIHMGMAAAEEVAAPVAEQVSDTEATEAEPSDGEEEAVTPPEFPADFTLDPLSHLAKAAGYPDSERWWEHLVEHRREAGEVFTAVLEAMTALRECAIQSFLERIEPKREAVREAHMRQTIRAAQKEGFLKIAVVCGAWHGPALEKMPPAKEDAALLKGLPKRKVAATWVPWTYSRLAAESGYGAGVASPGWYDFLWKRSAARREDVSIRWLVKVARLLRGEDLDASSASIIEAVRLAESLAGLRNYPLPGLTELNEATRTVLCFGDALPLELIRQKLIVSERLGVVPENTPSVPLAQDLAKEQKRLRLPPEAMLRQLDLDLRKPNDLDRSRLLHRLRLLGVEWGEADHQRGSQKGTFHELWRIQWEPEFAVKLIEAGLWGNSIATAAGAKVRHDADAATELPALTGLLDATLLSELPEAASHLMGRIQEVAALASEVGHLMNALPPLAEILRYGNVRQTDAAMVADVVDGLVARICIGLPGACGSLNDEAAAEMFERILRTHASIALLQKTEHLAAWHDVLKTLADASGLHGLIAGRACRLLLDAKVIDLTEAARRLSLALSSANPPSQSAAWVDGFLRNSGILLLHDEALWGVLDDWITSLSTDHFSTALPLLRRTFSTFEVPERRQMGERVARGAAVNRSVTPTATDVDEAQANQALPLLARLLGLKMEDAQ